jgi:hypothetical protein
MEGWDVRMTKSRTLRTNGMVEKFNGHIGLKLRSAVSVSIEVFPPVHDGFYRHGSGDLLMPGTPHETSFPEE